MNRLVLSDPASLVHFGQLLALRALQPPPRRRLSRADEALQRTLLDHQSEIVAALLPALTDAGFIPATCTLPEPQVHHRRDGALEFVLTWKPRPALSGAGASLWTGVMAGTVHRVHDVQVARVLHEDGTAVTIPVREPRMLFLRALAHELGRVRDHVQAAIDERPLHTASGWRQLHAQLTPTAPAEPAFDLALLQAPEAPEARDEEAWRPWLEQPEATLPGAVQSRVAQALAQVQAQPVAGRATALLAALGAEIAAINRYLQSAVRRVAPGSLRNRHWAAVDWHGVDAAGHA